GPDAARARGARADRPRLREQADRARARDRGEDREDARRPRAGQARRQRPHAGGAVRETQVLGPIADGGSDRARPTVAGRQSAIVTGASRGLGRALTAALAERGWRVVVDARDADALLAAWDGVPGVVAVPGDVSDPAHLRALVDAAGARIDLVVNNASVLGP